MSWRGATALALALLVVGCGAPAARSWPASDGPRSRCLNQPGRGESYGSDRPLIFLLCIESP